MSNIKEAARQYLEAGLSVIPLADLKEKTPAVPSWKQYREGVMTPEEIEQFFTTRTAGLAIVCGKVSGALEVIDVDSKYDLTGTLWNDFSRLIEDNLPDVYSRLVTALTQNKGYHIYYRSEEIDGNQKLAQRPATEEEQSKKKERFKVLIETRGEGGYIVAAPTPGYTILQGSLSDIPTITPQERRVLLAIAASFNEVEKPTVTIPTERKETSYSGGLSPLDEYNERGEVLPLLQARGWTIEYTSGERIFLKRPGDSTAKHSGNYHTGLRTLYVFSSSTEFEPEKGYSPSAVYTLLEHSGDYKAAARALLAQGYGTPGRSQSSPPTGPLQIPNIEAVNIDSGELILVEREEAVKSLKAAGLENVVATGGSNLTEEAVKDAITRGATRFTICFDREPGKAAKSTRSAIDTILKLSSQVCIAELPDLGGKTDPDRVIKEQGAGSLRRAIDEAAPHYLYSFREIANKYAALEEEQNGLTPTQQEDLIRELVASGRLIKDTIQKELYRAELLRWEPLRDLGLTEERLPKVLKEIEEEQQQQEQRNKAEALLMKGLKKIQGGDVKAGLQELREGLPAVSTIAKVAEFEEYLKPLSLEDIEQKLRNKPPGIKSGYTIGEEITYPAGALSFIAAGTGHGKTTFLINAILKAVSDYPEREFHFFSYEESREAIFRNTLNTFAGIRLASNNRQKIDEILAKGSGAFVAAAYQGDLPNFYVKQQKLAGLLESGRLRIHYTDYSSDELIDLITYLNANSKIGGAFIDYMQLLHKGNRGKNKYGSRQEELKQICIDLKDLAVETQLPIVVGAQFNREVVNPLLMHTSKIGEAGDIERIASLVVGLWDTNKRQIASDAEKKEMNNKPDLFAENQVYMSVLKNRQGLSGGEASFKYDGNLSKIQQPDNSR
jgi:replicative DNA helicase